MGNVTANVVSQANHSDVVEFVSKAFHSAENGVSNLIGEWESLTPDQRMHFVQRAELLYTLCGGSTDAIDRFLKVLGYTP